MSLVKIAWDETAFERPGPISFLLHVTCFAIALVILAGLWCFGCSPNDKNHKR